MNSGLEVCGERQWCWDSRGNPEVCVCVCMCVLTWTCYTDVIIHTVIIRTPGTLCHTPPVPLHSFILIHFLSHLLSPYFAPIISPAVLTLCLLHIHPLFYLAVIPSAFTFLLFNPRLESDTERWSDRWKWLCTLSWIVSLSCSTGQNKLGLQAFMYSGMSLRELQSKSSDLKEHFSFAKFHFLRK